MAYSFEIRKFFFLIQSFAVGYLTWHWAVIAAAAGHSPTATPLFAQELSEMIRISLIWLRAEITVSTCDVSDTSDHSGSGLGISAHWNVHPGGMGNVFMMSYLS